MPGPGMARGPEHPSLFRDREVAVLGTWWLPVATRNDMLRPVSEDPVHPGHGPHAAGGIQEFWGRWWVLQAKLDPEKESEELRSLTARAAQDCSCHLTATEPSPEPHAAVFRSLQNIQRS